MLASHLGKTSKIALLLDYKANPNLQGKDLINYLNVRYQRLEHCT